MFGGYAVQNRGDENHVFGRYAFQDRGDANHVFGLYAFQNLVRLIMGLVGMVYKLKIRVVLLYGTN